MSKEGSLSRLAKYKAHNNTLLLEAEQAFFDSMYKEAPKPAKKSSSKKE